MIPTVRDLTTFMICADRSQTASKDKLWTELEKTAMNPFSESKNGSQSAHHRRQREEVAQSHWYEQLGERWARALYSYYNWRTVRAAIDCMQPSLLW